MRVAVFHSIVCGLVALVSSGCDDGGGNAAPATVELYIDGALAPAAPRIDFPQAIAEQDQVAAQIELKNLGPGALELTGQPPARLEKDDRLAFTVTQPAVAHVANGDTAVVSVVFHPHSPGHSDARVVIEAKDREPFVVDLSGEGIAEGDLTPVLGVSVDGAVVGPSAATSFDFGAVATGETKSVTVRVENTGTGTLILPAEGAIDVDGGAFSVAAPDKTTLAAGEHVDVALTFEPELCASYSGTLAVKADEPAGDPLQISLSGRGGTNPQGYDNVTEELAQPDGDVALTDVTNGARKLAIGNLAYAFFAGRVGVYAWDGCALSAPRALSPTTTGLPVQYFGAQVALDTRGSLLLITAREVDEAWLFTLAADNAATRVATLATLRAGKGNGRGAALAGDGSVAFVGQSLADSGFNAHGVILAYPRPGAGWSDFTEARFRLAPSNPIDVQLVGAWVDTSADGSVVVGGGFGPNPGDGALGPPIVYLWEAAGPVAERTWGLSGASGNPPTFTEDVRLVSPSIKGDAAAVTISRDGATVAMPGFDGDVVNVYVWVRPGASWAGLSDANGRPPTATVTIGSGSKSRLALGPTGEFLIVASSGGAREVLRPATGWDASASAGRRWNVPFFGSIALSPDGLAFAGLDQAGAGWLVWR